MPAGSANLGFSGWAAGFGLGVVVFVVCMAYAWHLERNAGPAGAAPWPCLLRLVGLLGLAFGAGIGYLIGRAAGI